MTPLTRAIQEEKRSTFKIEENLERTIDIAEAGQPSLNGRELIFLSRFYLGKCYKEKGKIQKANNQFNIVFNRTQNNALKDNVVLARV